MTENIVDLSEYRAKLDQIKFEAEQEKEESKRDLILALCNWFNLKVDEWEAKRQIYKTSVDELDLGDYPTDVEREQEIMRNYLNHLKVFGRLLYVFHGITIIQTEGDGWENHPASSKAVLDSVLSNL